VTTQIQGSNTRPEVTVGATATAVINSITAVNTNHPDFFPYIVWVGSRPWKGFEGQVITYFQNQYVRNWVDQVDPPDTQPHVHDQAWEGNSNNFRGYLHNASGIIHIGDTLHIHTAGGNALGTQQTSMLDARWRSGEPILLPVITHARENGSNIDLTVSAFAWVKLDFPGNPLPSSVHVNQPLRGKIIRWVDAGHETGGGTPSGTTAPAKTVRLIPNQ